MKWLPALLSALVILAVVVASVGALLPARHQARVSRLLDTDPETAWGVIADFARYPEWRPALASVVRQPGGSGREIWYEEDRGGARVSIETLVRVPGVRLVRRIADPTLPRVGSWTVELAQVGGRTRITLTEEGELRHPVLRFVARYVSGLDAPARNFLDDLERRLDASAGGMPKRLLSEAGNGPVGPRSLP